MDATYMVVEDMVEFFITKNQLSEKGLLYQPNLKYPPSRGKNYIKIMEPGIFSTCGFEEYNNFSNN